MESMGRRRSTATTHHPYPTSSSSRSATPAKKCLNYSDASSNRAVARTQSQSTPRNGDIFPFQNARIFTPRSHFPSRMLPPLGTKPLDLDQGIASQTFEIGHKVCVRQFLGEWKGWTPWQEGVVVMKQDIISFAGTHGWGYQVRVKTADGSYEPTPRGYAAFYAEICSSAECSDYPEIDPRVCARRREQSDMVYARLPILNDDSRKIIWSPVRVLHWQDGEETAKVMSIDGPTSGRMFDVKEVLPYTRETANACRAQGHTVLDSSI